MDALEGEGEREGDGEVESASASTNAQQQASREEQEEKSRRQKEKLKAKHLRSARQKQLKKRVAAKKRGQVTALSYPGGALNGGERAASMVTPSPALDQALTPSGAFIYCYPTVTTQTTRFSCCGRLFLCSAWPTSPF